MKRELKQLQHASALEKELIESDMVNIISVKRKVILKVIELLNLIKKYKKISRNMEDHVNKIKDMEITRNILSKGKRNNEPKNP